MKCFLILILLLLNDSAYSEEPTPDTFIVDPGVPICLEVLENDPLGSTILSFTSTQLGHVMHNAPLFYFAQDNTVVVEAEHYSNISFTDPTHPDYKKTDKYWDKFFWKGDTTLRLFPDTWLDATGPDAWSTAMEYNVVFSKPGTYKIWIRGLTNSPSAYDDDTAHALWRNPVTKELNFVSKGSPISPFTNLASWLYCDNKIEITNDMLGLIFNFYIAMDEDGFTADRWAMSQDNQSWGSTIGPPESPSFECPLDALLYIPLAGRSGADTLNYTTEFGTTSVKIYVGITPPPEPSPSSSSSPTPSISVSPSATPSTSAAPIPSKTPLAVSPSTSPSPQASSSPSGIPDQSPSSSPLVVIAPSASSSASPAGKQTDKSSGTSTPLIISLSVLCSIFGVAIAGFSVYKGWKRCKTSNYSPVDMELEFDTGYKTE